MKNNFLTRKNPPQPMAPILLTLFMVLTLILDIMAESHPPPSTPSSLTVLRDWSRNSPYGILSMNTSTNSATVRNDRGRAVPSLTSSLKINQQSILLQDWNYLDIMGHFDRERIPERVVHAKGTGAHGYFEATYDITRYTNAVPFSKVGKKTPVFVRFSTSAGELGSADTVLDRRGFATKFYTEDGIWNLVGNDLPVFPIGDPILFPSLVHSVKKQPQNGQQMVDQLFDFNSLREESTMHAVHVFSDLGFPDGYRHMGGHSVHFFKCVNAQRVVTFCKFQWLPLQGLKNISLEQSFLLAGTSPEYATKDLYDAIARADFPQWTLFIQFMTPDEASKYRWNPFDSTKIVQESDHPFVPVGRLVLNKNPKDFFTEVEMSAFDPADLIPGIELGLDPLLLGRVFSYGDTQRYRLGANFLQLEINSPKGQSTPFQYIRGGACAKPANEGQEGPDYFPNSFSKPNVGQTLDPAAAETPFSVSGLVDRKDNPDDDNFSQPKIFLDALSPGERGRLVKNLSFFLKNVQTNIQERQIKLFEKVDPTFAQEIRAMIKLVPVGA